MILAIIIMILILVAVVVALLGPKVAKLSPEAGVEVVTFRAMLTGVGYWK